MTSFSDKVALVTGAASGIGRATAVAFGERGARVVVSDIDEEGGEETRRLVEEAGAEAFFFRADVADPDQARALVEATLDRWGRLDAAVNNAGIAGPMKPFADYDREEWKKVIAVNLDGVFYCMVHQIPPMVEAGGGAIVNMSSILGVVGFAQAPAYVSSKHGLVGMTRAAAVEYASRGVRINTVNPGFIETPMLDDAGVSEGTEMHEQLVAKHPIGRLGRPEEVAAATVWLCSDEASFITGESLLVDGGYTAQ